MMLVWVTGLIGFSSIIICLLSVKLLYRYINRYRFDESKYTLLFGWFRLRYMASLYIICIFGFAVLSTVFMLFTIL